MDSDALLPAALSDPSDRRFSVSVSQRPLPRAHIVTIKPLLTLSTALSSYNNFISMAGLVELNFGLTTH